jgi:hypothetical protein
VLTLTNAIQIINSLLLLTELPLYVETEFATIQWVTVPLAVLATTDTSRLVLGRVLLVQIMMNAPMVPVQPLLVVMASAATLSVVLIVSATPDTKQMRQFILLIHVRTLTNAFLQINSSILLTELLPTVVLVPVLTQ